MIFSIIIKLANNIPFFMIVNVDICCLVLDIYFIYFINISCKFSLFKFLSKNYLKT